MAEAVIVRDTVRRSSVDLSALRQAMRDLREKLSVETVFGGTVFAVGALASTLLVGLTLAGGARIDRAMAATTGHPSSVAAEDLLFIVGYGATILLGTKLASRIVVDAHARKVAGFAYFAAWTAVAAEGAGMAAAAAGWTWVAQGSGVITVTAALPATVTAVVGVTLSALRLTSFARPRNRKDRNLRAAQLSTVVQTSSFGIGAGAVAGPAHLTNPTPRTEDDAPGHQRARWLRGYDLGHPFDEHPDPSTQIKEPIGIGLSGGGIRAASVMLGAFQNEEFRWRVLHQAKYLVSVSGGGYTAGAFQQALTSAEPISNMDGDVLRNPKMAFAEGTAEEDHIRRNASYLASNPAEVLVALGLLASHLILNLVLLFGPAIILGVLAGCFYRMVPIASMDPSVAGWQSDVSPSFPTFSVSAWIAIGFLALLIVLSWSVPRLAVPHSADGRGRKFFRKLGPWLLRAVPGLRAVLCTVVVVTVVLPSVIWASAWLLHQCRGLVSTGSSIAAVVLTYGASLASLLWRSRKNLKMTSDTPGIPAAAPRGFAQILLVVVALTVLAVGWLLLFGGAATTVLDHNDAVTLIVAGVLLAAVALLGGLVDESTLSLHPFFRQRLARAFAVRAVKRGERVVAEPYDPSERTTLSSYGRLPKHVRATFPEVIFAASATLGEGQTPPGSNRVSYTFSSRFVGGPDIGYYPTAELEKLASPRLQRDLTVQGAVALSAAALAASVGAQNTKWYETLFAVSGVRLGAWMPNPRFLNAQGKRARRWYEPGLPRIRRASYLLRELVGLHPPDGPLVQVTDGGFYDNLGLIELFRRRCTTIYLFDASGDNPPPASTLAEVIMLAYQELGVEVDLQDDSFGTTPGTGTPVKPRDALTDLHPRLANTAVMTARFTYPKESGLSEGERTGRLIVAKASLWPDLPYPLLAYAMRNPTFPQDSTADQWFDNGQYGAYTALGRELGGAAVTAMSAMTRPRLRAGSASA